MEKKNGATNEPIDGERASLPEFPFAALVAFEGGLGVVAALVGRGIGISPLESIYDHERLSRSAALAVGWGLLATVPLAAGMLLLVRFPVGPFQALKRTVEGIASRLFAPLSLGQLALIAIAAGIGEEMLFRGLLQTGLERWLGGSTGIAIAGAALAFGLCHYLSFTYFATTAAMGVYLGALFHVADNLLAPIVAHAAYDFVALVYFVRINRPSGK